MSDRKRILVFSILVLAGGMFCAAAITIAILYQTALEEEREELVEIARGQAHFMEAVARFDAIHSQDDHPGGAREDWHCRVFSVATAGPGWRRAQTSTARRMRGDCRWRAAVTFASTRPSNLVQSYCRGAFLGLEFPR